MNPQTRAIRKPRIQAEKQVAAQTSRKVRLDMYDATWNQTWDQVRLAVWAWVHTEMNTEVNRPDPTSNPH